MHNTAFFRDVPSWCHGWGLGPIKHLLTDRYRLSLSPILILCQLSCRWPSSRWQQTCSQVSEVQVQVKSQVFEVKSKSRLKSLKWSPSQVLSLWGEVQVTSQVFVLFISNSSFSLLLRLNQFWNTDFTIWFSQQQQKKKTWTKFKTN